MTSVVYAFDAALGFLRVAFFVSAGAAAVICAIDWAVRTRRINPFSAVARFFRSSVDPLLAPVERRIVRAGGVPSSAPWWGLAFVVVLGILVISLLGFVRDEVIGLTLAVQSGPRGIYHAVVSTVISVLTIALMVRVISSWIPGLSRYSPWVRWSFTLTEPILAPLRRVVPSLGMIDITPIVAYFALQIIGWALLQLV